MLDGRIVRAAPFQFQINPNDIFLDRGLMVVAARVGSESHGTYIPPDDPIGVDDTDILGAIIPPIDRIVGMDGWNHWVQFVDELDLTFYSLEKIVRLWLKSNPNVLGLLWMRDEDIIVSSDIFERFRAEVGRFVSLGVVDAFGGYAYAQLRQIQKNRHEGYMGQKRRILVETFGYDIKHAAHLIRLLRMAKEFLQEGQLNVYRTHDADELKSIKRGEWTLEQVQTEAAILFDAVDELKEKSKLPKEPDRDFINAMLVETMTDHIQKGCVFDRFS